MEGDGAGAGAADEEPGASVAERMRRDVLEGVVPARVGVAYGDDLAGAFDGEGDAAVVAWDRDALVVCERHAHEAEERRAGLVGCGE